MKYYIKDGTAYSDVTPIRKTTTNAATFAATNGSSTITVTDNPGTGDLTAANLLIATNKGWTVTT